MLSGQPQNIIVSGIVNMDRIDRRLGKNEEEWLGARRSLECILQSGKKKELKKKKQQQQKEYTVEDEGGCD